MFEPDRGYQSVAALIQDIEDSSDDGSLEKSESLQGKLFWTPGFRSRKPWKMIVGVLGYAFLLWICFAMDVTSTAGMPAVGAELLFNRIAVFIWLLLTIFICFNYGDVHEQFPLLKSGK